MLGTQHYWLFLVSGILLNLTPGQDTLLYRAGLLTNVLNPKVALLYLAFLPQFVDPAASSKLIAFLFLGATFIATGTIWCVILALAASELAARFPTSGSTASIVRRLTGALFVGLGARLAVSK